MDSFNIQPPFFGQRQPDYPPLVEILRVTPATVPGPSGYGSSSFLGPVLYVAYVCQLRTDTLLPRDRIPCLVNDLNGMGLAPGYYTNGRLSGAFGGLPIYAVGASGAASGGLQVGGAGGGTASPVLSLPGLTQAQYNSLLINLSPAQIAKLSNLNASQLQVLLSLTVPQLQILTGSLTFQQLAQLVGNLTAAQLQALVASLNVPQLQAQLYTIFYYVETQVTWNSDQDNYALPATTTNLNVLVTASGGVELTGMSTVSPGAGFSRLVWITNDYSSSGTLTLTHLDPESLAANEFALPSSASYVLKPGEGVGVYYSGFVSIWECLDDAPGTGGFSNPMTTLGDIIYEDATPTAVRLAGNTTLTRKFLRQTGTGTVSAAPAWDTLTVADLPTIQAPALGDTLSPSAQPTVYKFTIPFNNATLAGTNAATAQVTLAVLPAGAVLLNTKIYHTLQFTGTGLSTLLAQLSAGGTQYGSARTSLASAPADPPTFAGSNLPDGRQAGTLTVVLGFSETGGGTLNNLSAGSVDVYLLVVQMG